MVEHERRGGFYQSNGALTATKSRSIRIKDKPAIGGNRTRNMRIFSLEFKRYNLNSDKFKAKKEPFRY
jgi:hypothetical protein